MKQQQGIVLVMSLIMLFLVTLLSITSVNVVNSNIRVVQNFESRNNARSAAISAVQTAIMSPGFWQRELVLDNTDDGMRVVVGKPMCMSAKPIPEAAQDIVDHDLKQQVCYQPGTVALCSYGQWQVTSTAYDQVTGAKYVFKQTLKTTTETSLIASACGPSDVVTEL